jgi:hypothetical protein
MNAPRDWPKRKKQTSKIRATRRGLKGLTMDHHTVTGPNAKKQTSSKFVHPAQRKVLPWIVTACCKTQKTGMTLFSSGAAQMLPGMNAPRDWPKPKQPLKIRVPWRGASAALDECTA